MKTPYPYDVSGPRKEWRPTPPRGQARGRHVARKDSTPQYVLGGSDLTERHRTPIRMSPEPPSKVRTSARSRDEEDPDMSRGPVLARV
jgi:hypothetical protein